MRKESEVGFEEIKAIFIRDNVATPERNAWPLGALDVADRQFGNWTRVVITPEEVRAVMLPWHTHDGVELVPVAGSAVSEAIEKLEIADRLSECYKRIQQLSSSLITPVFLTAAPINDQRYPDYKGLLERGRAGLTHLDGLHRLVAWGRENKQEIPAYVAGLK